MNSEMVLQSGEPAGGYPGEKTGLPVRLLLTIKVPDRAFLQMQLLLLLFFQPLLSVYGLCELSDTKQKEIGVECCLVQSASGATKLRCLTSYSVAGIVEIGFFWESQPNRLLSQTLGSGGCRELMLGVTLVKQTPVFPLSLYLKCSLSLEPVKEMAFTRSSMYPSDSSFSCEGEVCRVVKLTHRLYGQLGAGLGFEQRNQLSLTAAGTCGASLQPEAVISETWSEFRNTTLFSKQFLYIGCSWRPPGEPEGLVLSSRIYLARSVSRMMGSCAGEDPIFTTHENLSLIPAIIVSYGMPLQPDQS